MGFGKQSLSVREPTTYRVLRVRPYGSSDRAQGDKRLIRRSLTSGAQAAAFADEATRSAEAGYDLLGFGVRVYKGRYAFACRVNKQIEIETTKVRNCIVVTFTNLDQRTVGLLRFDGAGSDKVLLSEFIGVAARMTRCGDRTKIEVHMSAPIQDEAQEATLLRASELVQAIDGIIKRAAAHSSDFRSFPDRDQCVQWISACIFDLRIDTGSGRISITPISLIS